MEIRFNDVGYKSNLSYTNFIINSSIVGIIGKNKEYIANMIVGNIYPMVGDVSVGDVLVNEDNQEKINKMVGYVKKDLDKSFLNYSVLHHIVSILDHSNYEHNTITVRIKDALKMVGLDESYLLRKLNTLSTGEIKLLMLGTVLIYNPKILILDEPTQGLDFNNKRKVLKLINLLRQKYHKTIIILSEDVDFLYQYTENVIFADDCNKVKLYNSSEVFIDIETLISNNVDVPKLVKFTNLANKKGAKLHYHKDIRDLIKDIYKHV